MSLLQGLFECRVMTLAHIAAIYFDDKNEAAKKRVQKLKAAGFLAERPRRAYDPSLLHLTRKALVLLRDEGFISKYPSLSASAFEKRAQVSDLTIRHELDVLAVKAAFHKAARTTAHLSIAEFGTWPLLYEFSAQHPATRQKVFVRPDGFIRLHEKEHDGGVSEHTFFLEVDRSTETLDTLVTKAACYVDFYRNGGFALRNGASADQFRDFPFRVLVVCKSAERQNHFVERLASLPVPILTQVAVAVMSEASLSAFSTIWITPANRVKHSVVAA